MGIAADNPGDSLSDTTLAVSLSFKEGLWGVHTWLFFETHYILHHSHKYSARCMICSMDEIVKLLVEDRSFKVCHKIRTKECEWVKT